MFNAMTQAEIWLQDTFEKPLAIEDLANYLGYSASQVRRQFRNYFGISPSAYREKRRLERAAVLLSLTPQNIAQIALRCGYTNHSAFSRAFQRSYQLTPRNYRQTFNGKRLLQTHKYNYKTTIEKSPSRQAVLTRLYKGFQHIHELGNARYHTHPLAPLRTQTGLFTPAVGLPDLLAEKAEALTAHQDSPALYLPRTDIGLYIESQDVATHLALPVTHRRVDIASHYYAKTCFGDFAELPQALTATLQQLAKHPNHVHISGEAPRVLWYANHLELRTPLSI